MPTLGNRTHDEVQAGYGRDRERMHGLVRQRHVRVVGWKDIDSVGDRHDHLTRHPCVNLNGEL